MEIIKGLVLQFEYKFWTYYGTMEEMFTQNILKKKNTSSEDVLNELGKDGWELFTILQGKENCLFIFKRSKWVEKKAQEKQEDNANKIEPKFKIKDWIVDKSGLAQQVLDFRGGIYTCTYNSFSTDCESNYRLWTIQDAKDGDVLAEESCIFIIQKLVSNGTAAKTYFTLYDDGDFDDGTILYFDIDSTKPATKEQRELLFKKMKEAGCTFDFDKKELKKIDSYCKENCKGYKEAGKCYADGDCEAKRKAEQNHAWSEEDKDFMYDTLCNLTELKDKYGEGYGNVGKCIDWLKSFSPQNRWKPSNEQIKALRWVLNNIPYNKHKEEISGLLDQIKDL